MNGIRLSLIAGCLVALLLPSQAGAIPLLQLYIEGSTYDAATQTWVTSSNNFNLWVIGNTQDADIIDVNIAIAYFTGESGSVTLTPMQTSLLSDPSLPGAPEFRAGLGGDGT